MRLRGVVDQVDIDEELAELFGLDDAVVAVFRCPDDVDRRLGLVEALQLAYGRSTVTHLEVAHLGWLVVSLPTGD